MTLGHLKDKARKLHCIGVQVPGADNAHRYKPLHPAPKPLGVVVKARTCCPMFINDSKGFVKMLEELRIERHGSATCHISL